FGIPKTADECPRLYETLAEVARRVDTRPVDAVYLAPGSSIGVHQEGRGPFGIFGVKERVLTLGLSTMNVLTVGELKAILAHEFATALKKACTEGALFEMTAYNNVAGLLAKNQAFTNVYEAFRSFRNEQMNPEEREKLYQDLLAEKESLFASHPTFGERIEAVAPLPRADKPDDAPEMRLFENAELLE